MKKKLYKRNKLFIAVPFGIVTIFMLTMIYYKVYRTPTKDTKVVDKIYKDNSDRRASYNKPTASITRGKAAEAIATQKENNNYPVINTDENKAPFINK